MAVSIALMIAAWLIGSIPAAFIVTRLALGKDIRSVGSGNAGATNVFRVLGTKYAIMVFLFDYLKGFIPVLWILKSGLQFAVPAIYMAQIAGAAAVAGHMFPLFIGWKGGKGVATSAGVISALCPFLFPACLAVFLPVFLISRKMSLASVCTAVSVPFWYIFFTCATRHTLDWIMLSWMALISAIVVGKHWRNIRKIHNGTEEKLF